MSSIFRSPFVGMVLILITLPLIASCAPNANAEIISPSLGVAEKEAKAIADDIRLALVPTATPVPTGLAALNEEQIAAGLPDDVALALASADVAAGENLAAINACAGCHSLELSPAVELQGPTWYGLGDRAVNRAKETGVAGPAAYLYESISDPNAYLVDGYNEGIMLQTYLDTLSPDDFGALIAYILTLREE